MSPVWRRCSGPVGVRTPTARSRKRTSSCSGGRTRERRTRSSSTTCSRASTTAPASTRSTRGAPAPRAGPTPGWASTWAPTSRWPMPWPGRSSPPGSRIGSSSQHATTGFESYKQAVEPYTLAYAERETGVPAATIREMAHAYARAGRAMICWTLGITEHHNAVDNVLALINLALLTGHVGRYGSGLNPLRGQNNVQGGGDMGALPDRLPGFQHVEVAEFRREVRAAMGRHAPAGARLEHLGDVRGDGTGRAPGPLRPRREPAPVGGGPGPGPASAREPRLPGRAGHLPHRDRRDGRRRVPGRGRLVRVRGDGDQQRAPGPAGAQGPRAARRGPGRRPHPLRPGAPDGTRLGRAGCRGDLGRGARAQPALRRDELRPARGRPRAAMAVLRRGPSGRAVPPQPALGAADQRPEGRVPARRARPAGRAADRRVPAPAHHGAPARRVQHGRPDLGLRLAAATGREPRHLARGRGPARASATARWSASPRGAGGSRCRCGSTRACGPASRS